MMSDDLKQILLLVLVFVLVFQVEFRIFPGISQYLSINLEDIVLLVLGMVVILERINARNWLVTLRLGETTGVLIIFTGWLFITVLVATVRSSHSVIPSYLWLMKWFEFVLLFVLLQDVMNREIARSLIQLLIILGMGVVVYGIITSVQGTYRFRAFFGNPNTTAAFLNLIFFSNVWRGVNIDDFKHQIVYGIGSLLTSVAIVATGSRSGLLGLAVGSFVTLILVRPKITEKRLLMVAVGGFTATILIPYVVGKRVLSRLVNWFRIENGTIHLTDTAAARSFKTRIELIDKGMDLFRQQPIFGYGWFASPSRVGFLDVHYITLLVEVGLVGIILAFILYASFLRGWYNAYRKGICLGGAGFAWFMGLLAQSVGGNPIRSPQILLIMSIFLVAVVTLAE